MGHYYADSLSGTRLKRCYDIAPLRTRQYLEAEIQYVLSKIRTGYRVIELGCGYGRVIEYLVGRCAHVMGIDLSLTSLRMGQKRVGVREDVGLAQMDAAVLGFQDDSFDVVICIQNGISAFKVDPEVLVRECMRVACEGGLCIFSSYSDKFWEHRLEWFRLQSAEGLLGEIDWEKTMDGKIVCKDGFTATTYRPYDFQNLAEKLGLDADINEVDESSLFWEIHV